MSNQSVGSRGTYTYITSYDSPNYNGSADVKCIVVHHWGNDGQKFDTVASYLCKSAAQASAHYVLEDGKVACLVAPYLRAWHVASNDFQNNNVLKGYTDVNAHSIGIECRPECTDGDQETLAQLIADLWVDYGKVPVYGHKDFMSTACPYRYYNKLSTIVKRAEAIYATIGTTTNTTSTEDDELMAVFTDAEIKALKALVAHGTTPSDWAKTELQEAIDAGITTGERPQDAMTRQEGAIMVKRAYEKLK